MENNYENEFKLDNLNEQDQELLGEILEDIKQENYFEEELLKRGISREDIIDFYNHRMKLTMNLGFIYPVCFISIAQAFIPVIRSNGYYDFQQCLMSGILVCIVVNLVLKFCMKIWGGMFPSLFYTGLANGHSPENEYSNKMLDKVAARKNKQK